MEVKRRISAHQFVNLVHESDQKHCTAAQEPEFEAGWKWTIHIYTESWTMYRPGLTRISDWYVPEAQTHLPRWIRPA